MKVLAAIDGSGSSLCALCDVIDHTGMFTAEPEIFLVNVQPPLPPVGAGAVLGADAVAGY